jgi:hypothetical protein
MRPTKWHVHAFLEQNLPLRILWESDAVWLVVTLTEHCRHGSFCWRDTGVVSACAQKSLGWLLLINGKQTGHFLVDSFTVCIREALSATMMLPSTCEKCLVSSLEGVHLRGQKARRLVLSSVKK